MTSAAENGLVEAALGRLDRQIEHVREPGMRRALVREVLLELGPDAACGLIARVLGRRCDAGSSVDRLADLIHQVAIDDSSAGLGYDDRSAIYNSASEGGHERVMRMLRGTPSTRPESTDSLLPREVAEIPLGRRRSLARGPDRYLLEKLARDSDPVVIANLLRNPAMREADVVRIATLRPVPPTTLAEIARSERWAIRTAVRTALVRNPQCPADTAARMIPGLPLAVLREMRADGTLPAPCAEVVRAELERRDAATR